MKLYMNPLSTYSQKTLIAFYENGVKFTPEVVNLFDPELAAQYKKVYPLAKIPLLIDGDNFVPESSIIIEYIDTKHPTASPLIPKDPETARKARFHDRAADLYVNEPCAVLFFDAITPPNAMREPERVAKAKATLDISFQHLDEHLAKRTWVAGERFSIADCALAAPLGYLRNIYPFAKYPNLTAYWNRLAERPSVVRVLEEARPLLQKMMAR